MFARQVQGKVRLGGAAVTLASQPERRIVLSGRGLPSQPLSGARAVNLWRVALVQSRRAAEASAAGARPKLSAFSLALCSGVLALLLSVGYLVHLARLEASMAPRRYLAQLSVESAASLQARSNPLRDGGQNGVRCGLDTSAARRELLDIR